MRVKSVVLWGRSMGAATAILYQSPRFRSDIKHYLRDKKGVHNYNFAGILLLF